MLTHIWKSHNRLFLFCHLLLAIITASGIYYFYQQGAWSSVNYGTLLESQTIGNSIDISSVEKLNQLLEENSFSQGEELIIGLKRQYEKTIMLNQSLSNDQLLKTLNQSQNAITQLRGKVKIEDINKSFNAKLESFNTFVMNNNWKTLTQMSQNLLVKHKRNMNKKSRYFAYMDGNFKDIQSMKRVTIASGLSRVQKQEIINRLESLESEKKLVEILSELKASTLSSLEPLRNQILSWRAHELAAITNHRQGYETMVSNLRSFLLIVFSMILMLTFVGFLVLKKISLRSQRKAENWISEIFEKIILDNDLEVIAGSNEFMNSMHRLKSYLNKRLSFGKIFQESIPFPAIILDENMTLNWANQTFFEQWHIKEAGVLKGNYSWIDLVKMTNLNDDDPISDVLSQKMGGVFQIQVELGESGESIPYEMYACPVNDEQKWYVVILFYPLIAQEESIKSQADNIVRPVIKLVDAFSDNQVSSAFLAKIESEFLAIGKEDLFNSFKELFYKYNQEKCELLDDIEKRKRSNKELKMVLDGLKEKNENLRSQAINLQKSVDRLKNNFLNYVTTYEKHHTLSSGLVERQAELVQKFKEISYANNEIQNLNNDLIHSLQSISDFKQLLRDMKKELTEIKYKSSWAIQTAHSIKRTSQSHEVRTKLEQFIAKLQNENTYLEDLVTSVERKVTQADVTVSKIHMILEKVEKDDQLPSGNSHDFVWDKKIEHQSRESLQGIERDMSHIENDVIQALKNGYQGNQMIVKLIQEIDQSLEVETEVLLNAPLLQDNVAAVNY